MGKYLAALRKLEAGDIKTEKAGVVALINLKNPPAASILGLLGNQSPIFTEKKVTRPTVHACSNHTAFLVNFEDTATDLPRLCELLGLSWEQVEDAGILAPYDQGMIDGGAYNALWVIRYLLGWQVGGYFVSVDWVSDDVIEQRLRNLQLTQPYNESAREWLSANIRKKTGDTV